MTDLQIIRRGELAKLLGVSLQTLWRMEKRGDLPPKTKISNRAVGWSKQAISEWLESKTEVAG